MASGGCQRVHAHMRARTHMYMASRAPTCSHRKRNGSACHRRRACAVHLLRCARACSVLVIRSGVVANIGLLASCVQQAAPPRLGCDDILGHVVRVRTVRRGGVRGCVLGRHSPTQSVCAACARLAVVASVLCPHTAGCCRNALRQHALSKAGLGAASCGPVALRHCATPPECCIRRLPANRTPTHTPFVCPTRPLGYADVEQVAAAVPRCLQLLHGAGRQHHPDRGLRRGGAGQLRAGVQPHGVRQRRGALLARRLPPGVAWPVPRCPFVPNAHALGC